MFTYTSTSNFSFGLAQNGVNINRLIPYIGPIFFFGLLLVVQSVYYFVLFLCNRECFKREVLLRHQNKIKSNLFYNTILTFVVESYLPLAIGVQLSFSCLMFVTYSDCIDSCLTLAAIIPVFLLPFIVFCFLRQNRSEFGDEHFVSKFESLWEGLLTEKESD